MTKEEALFKYTLRIADSALILGQRLSEWCGHGPFLEEDLALTNITLDLIGQTNALLAYAGKVEGKGRDQEALAFKRMEREFYNNLLVEQPNTDFAFTLVRQFFMDAYHFELYSELSKSKDETIAALAAKSLKEITYHLRHTSNWMERLGDGTEESHQKTQNAINELWRFTGDIFDTDESDVIMQKEGIAPDMTKIHEKWMVRVSKVVEASTLKLPENAFMHKGSKKGIHTEHLGFMLAEMQYLPRVYPNATW